MGQSSELEREIRQKTGGASGGASQKSGPPLESPLPLRLSHKVFALFCLKADEPL